METKASDLTFFFYVSLSIFVTNSRKTDAPFSYGLSKDVQAPDVYSTGLSKSAVYFVASSVQDWLMHGSYGLVPPHSLWQGTLVCP